MRRPAVDLVGAGPRRPAAADPAGRPTCWRRPTSSSPTGRPPRRSWRWPRPPRSGYYVGRTRRRSRLASTPSPTCWPTGPGAAARWCASRAATRSCAPGAPRRRPRWSSGASLQRHARGDGRHGRPLAAGLARGATVTVASGNGTRHAAPVPWDELADPRASLVVLTGRARPGRDRRQAHRRPGCRATRRPPSCTPRAGPGPAGGRHQGRRPGRPPASRRLPPSIARGWPCTSLTAGSTCRPRPRRRVVAVAAVGRGGPPGAAALPDRATTLPAVVAAYVLVGAAAGAARGVRDQRPPRRDRAGRRCWSGRRWRSCVWPGRRRARRWCWRTAGSPRWG